jgi:EAL domain-containing protein (putative c-di-GMP-specific phosphodiesterase class I)
VREPFALGASQLQVTCSIGIATAASSDGWDPDAVLRQADLAMYEAKRDGRGAVEVFVPELQQDLFDRLRLDQALASDPAAHVQVHYQPIVGSDDGRTVGVEALLRWHDGDLVLRPDVVVERAEATGTIGALGRVVLRTAVHQTAEWRRTIAPALHLSVNVSVAELERPGYADDVVVVLAAARLPASALTIEVTESTLATDNAALVDNLHGLRTAGVSLSVDDFGTGWSSMSRLRVVAPDEIKIDRSFVAVLAAGADEAIVRAILALSRELGCRVVAEGVEHEEQRSALVALGCPQLQGYLFGRPVRAEVLEQHLLDQSCLTRLPVMRRAAPPSATSSSARLPG